MMLLTDAYPMPPGCCRICGGSQLPAIDTEIYGEQGIRDWRWYICGQCIRHMYVMVGGEDGHGVVSRLVYEGVAEALDTSEKALGEATEALEALRTVAGNRLLGVGS